MFFAGVGVTLAVVLVVLVLFLLYKKRRKASKLSTDALERVEMKSETASEPWRNNQVRVSLNIEQEVASLVQ